MCDSQTTESGREAKDISSFRTSVEAAAFGLHRRRTLYLIRHGEAEHNVLEAAAQKKAKEEAEALNLSEEEIYERMETARKSVLNDISLRDAKLTDKGRQQARVACDRLRELIESGQIHHPTEAMVSPLSRCLETCKILLDDADFKAHIRPEIAERRTLYPPDKPKPLDQLLRATRDDDRFRIVNPEHLKPERINNEASAKAATDGDDSKEQTLKPLFEALKENDSAMLSFAEGFRDKVKILFEHFDHDKDGKLKYDELAALQTATSDDGYEGERLSKEMYVMACQSLNCHPDQGLSLEALKFTYAADGSDIDADYDKVFDKDGKPRKVVVKIDLPSKEKKEESKNEDKVYEMGSNGVIDISS